MLTDTIECLDCRNDGSHCTCANGPSWSKERKVFDDLIAFVKRSPHSLHCSKNSSNPDRKCGCGRDDLLARARGL
jgi:hypothetical protein